MQLEKVKMEKEKDKRLKMWCECCEQLFDRWLIDMVEPEPVVFEINAYCNELMAEHGGKVEFNFACPTCVTELYLQPLQTDRAKTFRDRNEKLRMALAPTPVH